MLKIDEFLRKLECDLNLVEWNRNDVGSVIIIEYTKRNQGANSDDNETLKKYFSKTSGVILSDNDAAEIIYDDAISEFLNKNYEISREMFHSAYKMCTNDYENKNEYKNYREFSKVLKLNEEARTLVEVQKDFEAAKIKTYESVRIFPESMPDKRKLYLNKAANMLYSIGAHYEISGKLDEAMKSYSEAIDFSPDHNENLNLCREAIENVKARIIFDEGMKFYDKSDFRNAILKFRKALKIYPVTKVDSRNEVKIRLASALNNYARDLIFQQNYEEALKIYDELFEVVISDDPNYDEYLNNVNVTYARILNRDAEKLCDDGKYSESIAKYKLEIEICPESQKDAIRIAKDNMACVFNNWGIQLSKEQKNKEALDKFEKAVELSTNEARLGRLRLNLNRSKADNFGFEGDKFYNDKKYEEATASYRKGLKTYPDDNPEYKNLFKNVIANSLNAWGAVLQLQGKFQDAKMKFQEAVAICSLDNPSLSMYRHNMNEMLKMVDNLEKMNIQ